MAISVLELHLVTIVFLIILESETQIVNLHFPVIKNTGEYLIKDILF